jgi:S1-C subfamily serine protease
MRTATVGVAALALLGLMAGRASADGFIGVQIAAAEVGDGVVIQDVVPDSPAMKAGLKAEDLVVKVDGKEFKGLQGFVEVIKSHKKGDKITLTIFRDGNEKEVKVTVGEPMP